MDNTQYLHIYDDTKRVSCMQCNKTFGRNADLRKHVHRFHYEKWKEIIASQKQKSFEFSCVVCSKNFSYKKHLTFHLKKAHGMEVTATKRRRCPMCDYVAIFRTEFYSHFQNVHEIVVEVEELHLKPDEFIDWKHTFEVKTNSKFVIEHTSPNKIVQYKCHRSGYFKPQGNGKRCIKTQGTKKIDCFCPASIKTIENNGTLTVSVVKTHVGHQNDLEHLSLTIQERQSLAAKIASKVPFEEILDEVRDSVTSAPMERLHLLTRKDLHNIKTYFNLNSEPVSHENDTISVDSWENEIERNDDLIINLDARHVEPETTSKDLQKSASNNTCTIPLNEKKLIIKKQFNAILNSATTEEELEALESLVKPIQPALDAMKASTSSSNYKYRAQQIH